MVVVHSWQARLEQRVGFRADVEGLRRFLDRWTSFSRWQFGEILLYRYGDPLGGDFTKNVFEVLPSRAGDPAADLTVVNNFADHSKDINVGVVRWRNVKVRLNFRAGRGCDRKSLPARRLGVNPEVATALACPASALHSLGSVVVWVWRAHPFLEVKELAEAFLPQEPTGTHINFRTLRRLCSDFPSAVFN